MSKKNRPYFQPADGTEEPTYQFTDAESIPDSAPVESPAVEAPKAEPSGIPTADRVYDFAAATDILGSVRPNGIYNSVVYLGEAPEGQVAFCGLLIWNTVMKGGKVYIPGELATTPPFAGKECAICIDHPGWCVITK